MKREGGSAFLIPNTKGLADRMNAVVIVPFEPRYTDKVKQLVAAVLDYLDLDRDAESRPPSFEIAYDDSDLNRIAEIYANRSRFWLAIADDHVIGMVAIQEVDKTVALLRRMFVAPAYHGAGVGRLLLETALEFARTQNYHTVQLDTHIGMTRAHRFYEKQGFQQFAEDEWQRHYTLSLA